MRALLQRVSSASVVIDGSVRGEISHGLLVLQGIGRDDTADDGQWLADKITKLRIFADETGAMNRSVIDVAGGILLVSQFTLHANTQKGTRPSFNDAAKPEHARPLYERFIGQLTAALGRPIATGEFGAYMNVALTNDGPVTLMLDSKNR
jgi:D-aminoacyl-tRNA deacylase